MGRMARLAERVRRGGAVAVVVGLLATAGACSRDDTPPPGAAPATTPATCSPANSASTSGTVLLPPVGAGSPSGQLAPPPGPGSLSGTVTDGACTQGVGGISVWLYGPNETTVIGATRTADDGTYSFASIAPGSYRIGFQDLAGRWGSVYFPDAPDFTAAQPVVVTAARATADEKVYTPGSQPVPDYTGSGAGGRVAVIGDSLVQQTSSALRDKLEPLGPTSVRGIAGQRIDQMQDVAAKYAATHPDVVVIALGNNDLRQQWPIDQSMASLRAMIDRFPDARCIAVLTINSHTLDQGFNLLALQYHSELTRLIPATGRLQLIDWDEDVRLLQAQGLPDSTWFTDGLHLNAVGAGAYATAIQGGVQRCPR